MQLVHVTGYGHVCALACLPNNPPSVIATLEPKLRIRGVLPCRLRLCPPRNCRPREKAKYRLPAETTHPGYLIIKRATHANYADKERVRDYGADLGKLPWSTAPQTVNDARCPGVRGKRRNGTETATRMAIQRWAARWILEEVQTAL
ncbi:hypothetical protein KM043_009860 [Ampulex compressa]|nr:hypothetical protein KM043_009860 [Ampulex compressa]